MNEKFRVNPETGLSVPMSTIAGIEALQQKLVQWLTEQTITFLKDCSMLVLPEEVVLLVEDVSKKDPSMQSAAAEMMNQLGICIEKRHNGNSETTRVVRNPRTKNEPKLVIGEMLFTYGAQSQVQRKYVKAAAVEKYRFTLGHPVVRRWLRKCAAIDERARELLERPIPTTLDEVAETEVGAREDKLRREQPPAESSGGPRQSEGSVPDAPTNLDAHNGTAPETKAPDNNVE